MHAFFHEGGTSASGAIGGRPRASMVPAAPCHGRQDGGGVVRPRRRRCRPRHHRLSAGAADSDDRRYGGTPWARRAPRDHPGSRPSEGQGLIVLA